MVLADVYDLLNDVFFEVLRAVFIACLMGLAIFLGAKLRKHHDKKKEMKELESAATVVETEEVDSVDGN